MRLAMKRGVGPALCIGNPTAVVGRNAMILPPQSEEPEVISWPGATADFCSRSLKRREGDEHALDPWTEPVGDYSSWERLEVDKVDLIQAFASFAGPGVRHDVPHRRCPVGVTKQSHEDSAAFG